MQLKRKLVGQINCKKYLKFKKKMKCHYLKGCTQGWYGKDCKEKCGHCLDENRCFHINGTCISGCQPGYKGLLCKSSE